MDKYYIITHFCTVSTIIERTLTNNKQNNQILRKTHIHIYDVRYSDVTNFENKTKDVTF